MRYVAVLGFFGMCFFAIATALQCLWQFQGANPTAWWAFPLAVSGTAICLVGMFYAVLRAMEVFDK